MAQASEASGSVGDASVRTSGDPVEEGRNAQYLRALADEAEDAIPRIEQTIEDLKKSLAAKKAELKQFRADADEVRKDAE